MPRVLERWAARNSTKVGLRALADSTVFVKQPPLVKKAPAKQTVTQPPKSK